MEYVIYCQYIFTKYLTIYREKENPADAAGGFCLTTVFIKKELRVIQGCDAGKDLAFEELEGGAAACGDMRHFLVQPELEKSGC